MTRPTARVLTLLEVLQSGGTRTAAELAARVGVDERTLRRYIEHLIDLEVPVESVRGRYGGYRLAPGFRMPPLMLTDEEALAVLVGLETGYSVAAAASAAAKVRRVLPRALAGRLDGLLAAMDFTSPLVEAPAMLLTFATAARDRQPVAMVYHERLRTLHPYGIVAHHRKWYVTGADSASGEVRTFRLDRISSASLQPGSFTVPDGFSPVAQVTAGAAYRHEVSVLVDGPLEVVRRRLPGNVATASEAGEAQTRVRLRAERLDWVPAVLAGLNLPFTIEHPDELRAHVRDLAARLARYADVPGA